MKPSLFVATPAFGGLATVQYMRSILELWPVLAAAGIDVSWNVTVDSLVTRARNELVARFLRSEATHLFFVDSDIGFTPEQVLEMLRFNEPFVAGVYPLKALPLSGVGKKLEPCERRGRFVENFVGPSSCS